MVTELRRFVDAYASITVATYEPLILGWISQNCLQTTADILAKRVNASQTDDVHRPTASLLAQAVVRNEVTPALALEARSSSSPSVQRAQVDGFPDAVEVAGRVYLHGVVDQEVLMASKDVSSETSTSTSVSPRLVPVEIAGGPAMDSRIDFQAMRGQLFTALSMSAANALAADTSVLTALTDAMEKAQLPVFFPTKGRLPEAQLSPIGLTHLFRQLYFAGQEGVGPLEQAFTIAPLEVLEVLSENIHRQVHEEFVEVGSETISETAQEMKEQDEVADKVATMMQRDTNAAFSAEGGANFLVWHAGASANVDLKTSSQRSRDTTTKHLRETTKSATQRMRQTLTVRTRGVEETTTTATSRRIIRNESNAPVSYGLRRVLRKINVKVQYLGPRLVWQLYLRNPGAGIALSQFVQFREANITPPPETPPDMPPRPRGGTDTGSAAAAIVRLPTGAYQVSFTVLTAADRVVTSVSVDSVVDLGGDTKDTKEAAPLSPVMLSDATPGSRRATIDVARGKSNAVTINYSYTWEPAPTVLDDWEKLRQQKKNSITEERLKEQFERHRDLITARSKVRSRPAADLRREERYEVMNRMVSQLFNQAKNPGGPTPLEIEYFHHFFDIDGIFTYNHPSWWKPRYTASKTSLERIPYEVTGESQPAPLGSSLGWCLQLDGDDKRNEFLNSPWVRVCVPIRPGREREAVGWVADHIEGRLGFDSPLVANLLDQIEGFRSREGALGRAGPDFVAVDSTVGDEPGDPTAPFSPQGTFPVVDQFEVAVPTDGFVYDQLQLSAGP